MSDLAKTNKITNSKSLDSTNVSDTKVNLSTPEQPSDLSSEEPPEPCQLALHDKTAERPCTSSADSPAELSNTSVDRIAGQLFGPQSLESAQLFDTVVVNPSASGETARPAPESPQLSDTTVDMRAFQTGGTRKICSSCGQSFFGLLTNCPTDGTVLSGRLTPGAILFNKFEILNEIGSGGMGVVYKAKQIYLNNIVALKTLHPELSSPEMIARLHREAKAAQPLRHRNLVTVLDFDVTADNQPVMIMEFVEGESLSSLLSRSGALPQHYALNLFIQAAEVMSFVHQHNILHRDLKPSNLLISNVTAAEPLLRVLDFGVAKVSDSVEGGLTRTGQIVGSPYYMSPEQTLGQPLDVRSDIYSLGCVMYECLTGTPPFQGENTLDTLMKHAHEMPRRMSEACTKRISQELEEIVAKALEKKPEKRFQTMSDLVLVLRMCRSGSYKAKPLWQKRAFLPAVAVGTVTSILLFTAIGQMFNVKSTPAKQKTIDTASDQIDSQALEAIDNPAMVVHSQIQNHRKVLIANNSLLGDEDLAVLGGHGIEQVQVQNTSIGNKAVEHLAREPIQKLDVSNTAIDDDGLNKIWRFKALKEIYVGNMKKVSAEGFRDILQASQLESLHVKNASIDAKTIGLISSLPSLKLFDLAEPTLLTSVLGDDLIPLKKLPRLQTLAVKGISATKNFLLSVRQMHSLTDLDLTNANIDNELLHYLLPCPQLRSLTLSGNIMLTDVGVNTLAECKNLEHLNLTNLPLVTKQTMKVLREALPNCVIHDDQKLYETAADGHNHDAKAIPFLGQDLSK